MYALNPFQNPSHGQTPLTRPNPIPYTLNPKTFSEPVSWSNASHKTQLSTVWSKIHPGIPPPPPTLSIKASPGWKDVGFQSNDPQTGYDFPPELSGCSPSPLLVVFPKLPNVSSSKACMPPETRPFSQRVPAQITPLAQTFEPWELSRYCACSTLPPITGTSPRRSRTGTPNLEGTPWLPWRSTSAPCLPTWSGNQFNSSVIV
jgi:hypothetical protein